MSLKTKENVWSNFLCCDVASNAYSLFEQRGKKVDMGRPKAPVLSSYGGNKNRI